MKKLLAIVTILFAGALHGAALGEVVNVYTSAQVAPLVTPDGKGVYPDLIDYLNRQKLGELSFKLIYLPRKRLQMKVENGELDGIVIGMMPNWFGDAEQKKYLWTVPFAVDRYVIALPPGQDHGSGTLAGKSLGMVLGYHYPDLEVWVRQQGLVRADGPSDELNLEKLRLGRVDGVAAAESVVRYHLKLHPGDRFQLLSVPSHQTERRFLVPHSHAAVYDKIAPVVRKLRDDPEWQRLMSQYQ